MSRIVFHCKGKDVAEVLARVAQAKSPKTTLPVLGCVAVRVIQGGITVEATNLDQWHRAPIPCELTQGSVGQGYCVRTDLFLSMLRKANGTSVSVSWDDKAGVVEIDGGERVGKIRTLPIEEFAEVKIDAHPLTGNLIDGKAYAAALKSVAFMQSTDVTRAVCCGIYLDADGCAVATNGRALAMATLGADVESAVSGKILPSDAIPAICDLLRRAEMVRVSDQSGVVFALPTGEVYHTRVIDGNYPNYRQVIPNYPKPTRLRMKRDLLVSALEWAGMSTCEKMSHGVKFLAEGEVIIVEASNPDTMAESRQTLTLLDAVETRVRFSANVDYLRQMAAQGEGDEVTLEIDPDASGNVSGPILVKEGGWTGVVMPIRVAS